MGGPREEQGETLLIESSGKGLTIRSKQKPESTRLQPSVVDGGMNDIAREWFVNQYLEFRERAIERMTFRTLDRFKL